MPSYTYLRKAIILPLGLLALLVVYFASSGCGGSSSEQALAKQEFIARADHICASIPSTVVAAGANYQQKHPGAEEADIVRTVAVPIFEKEIRQIRALGLPNEGGAEVSAFVRAFEGGLDDLKEDPLDGLVAETNPFMKARTVADAYGLKACNAYP
jgi:hypothetical protein